MPPGPHVLHVLGTRTSLGRTARTDRVPWLSPQARQSCASTARRSPRPPGLTLKLTLTLILTLTLTLTLTPTLTLTLTLTREKAARAAEAARAKAAQEQQQQLQQAGAPDANALAAALLQLLTANQAAAGQAA